MGIVERILLLLLGSLLVSCAKPYVGRCFLGACESTSASSAPAPTSASGLTVATDSATSITLSWTDDSSNETGFLIERKVSAGAWTELTTVGAGITGYTDTGLDPLTVYSYRVTALGSGGNSSPTSASVALTDFDDSGSWTDDFSILDSTYWTASGNATLSGNKVYLQHAASTGTIGLDSTFKLVGDFDVSVSYSSVDLGACTYAAIGMRVFDLSGNWYNVERRNWIPGNQIWSELAPNSAPDASGSGTFRIRRSAATIFVYRSDGTTVLASAACSTEDFFVQFYGRDDGNGCPAEGYFDDISIQ